MRRRRSRPSPAARRSAAARGPYLLYPVVVVLMLGSVTSVAAGDYSPWLGRTTNHDTPLLELVRSKKGGDSCCKHCTKGQPCGNSCISTKYKCHQPPGCAC